MASTLASFHRRAPRAVSASVHSAARTPATLLAAIDTPVPVQQHTTRARHVPRDRLPHAPPDVGPRVVLGQHHHVVAGVDRGAR
jgi:hypothetical protein